MKTTQRILAGWMAVVMSISAGFAHASLPDGMAAALLGGAALGQQGGSDSIFSGFGFSRIAPPNDPFAARGAALAPAADANGVTRLPPTTGPQPPAVPQPYGDMVPAPQGNTYPAPGFAGDRTNGTQIAALTSSGDRSAPGGDRSAPGGNRARSDALLRGARLALAVTDVRRAGDMVALARQEQVRYAPNEDSPERVEAAIAHFVEVNRLERSTEENRKTYARMLMEQSEALLQWGELEQADKLAALAVEQQVTYGPFDAKPDDLLKRIAILRQRNNPAGPQLIDNRYADPNAVGPSLAGRQQAVELMRQIRGAWPRNRSDRPKSFAGNSMDCGFRKMPLPRAKTAPAWSSRMSSRRWPATSRAWFRPAVSTRPTWASNRPFTMPPRSDPQYAGCR